MDAGAGVGGILHVTWQDDDSVWTARNSLDDNDWTDVQMLFYDPDLNPVPQVAVGTDGMVAVAFTIYDDDKAGFYFTDNG